MRGVFLRAIFWANSDPFTRSNNVLPRVYRSRMPSYQGQGLLWYNVRNIKHNSTLPWLRKPLCQGMVGVLSKRNISSKFRIQIFARECLAENITRAFYMHLSTAPHPAQLVFSISLPVDSPERGRKKRPVDAHVQSFSSHGY